jgi:hypothetical protein
MFLSLLLASYAAPAPAGLLGNQVAVSTTLPCATKACLTFAPGDMDMLFPGDIYTLSGILAAKDAHMYNAATLGVFRVTGSLGGMPISLDVSPFRSDGSAVAYGTIDTQNNGKSKYVAMYLRETTTGSTWAVTAYFYQNTSTAHYATLTGDLDYVCWGSASSPVCDWELENARLSYTATGSISSASDMAVSMVLNMSNIYYYNLPTQSAGTTTDYEFLEFAAGTGWAYLLNNASSTSTSTTDSVSQYNPLSTSTTTYKRTST